MIITLDVPHELGICFSPFSQQLPRLLEIGLRELNTPHTGLNGLNEILEFLTKLPSPEEILALRPAPELQRQIDDLLEKRHTSGLSGEEESQWQHYEYSEYLVRIAKANALLKLKLQ